MESPLENTDTELLFEKIFKYYLLDINFIIMCLNPQRPYMAVSLVLIESTYKFYITKYS